MQRFIKKTKIIKLIMQLFLIALFNPVFSQVNSKEITINKTSVSDKNINDIKYTNISFKSYDANTNEKLPIILRVDNISLIVLDSTAQTISLSKGSHFVQAGWIGYNYSKKIKIKVSLSEEYEIKFYLKRATISTLN